MEKIRDISHDDDDNDSFTHTRFLLVCWLGKPQKNFDLIWAMTTMMELSC